MRELLNNSQLYDAGMNNSNFDANTSTTRQVKYNGLHSPSRLSNHSLNHSFSESTVGLGKSFHMLDSQNPFRYSNSNLWGQSQNYRSISTIQPYTAQLIYNSHFSGLQVFILLLK